MDANYPCMCGLEQHREPSAARRARLAVRDPEIPKNLHDDPFVHWYRCDECGRCWLRIGFEGYHTKSFTFYATLAENSVIDAFHIDQIDEIFLASSMTFVGGYDRGDRTSVYQGGFPVDPWSGFRRTERLLKAKEFAVKAHGRQMYGDKPYVVHLEHVHEVMKRYHLCNSNLLVMIAGWLHDVLEDTAITQAELARHFGEEVADMVHRVSDEPGADRAERKRNTYRKIRGHLGATLVKLCDRIANVEASADVPEKLGMYKKEHQKFREAIFVPEHTFLKELWGHLDRLLGFEH